MSADETRVIATEFLEALGRRDLESVERVLAPDILVHGPGRPPAKGSDLYLKGIRAFLGGLSDFGVRTEILLAEGDKAAGRVVLKGVHSGDLMGLKPTGKAVALEEHFIVRVENRRIVEKFGVADTLGLMRQLGAVAAPA